jgi:hypothetical protein
MLLFRGRKLGPSWPVLIKKENKHPMLTKLKKDQKKAMKPIVFQPKSQYIKQEKKIISKFWNASFSLPDRYWG